MERDFDQLIGDARYWLRTTSTRKLTFQTDLLRIGFVRRNFHIEVDPTYSLLAYDISSLSGVSLTGGIEVTYARRDTGSDLHKLEWREDQLFVASGYCRGVAPIEEVSGVVLDMVYTQLAVPMHKILQSIQAPVPH